MSESVSQTRRPVASTAAASTSPSEWWESQHATQLIEAAELLAAGQGLKAALMLRDLIRIMEDLGANRSEVAPVLRLSADAWRQASVGLVRHSSEHPFNVRQRMRVDFLEEARAAYNVLLDIPNVMRTTRSIGSAYMAQGKFLAAMQQLEDAAVLATKYETLDFVEVMPLWRELGAACKAAFEYFATNAAPAHLDAGPRAAGYLLLVGDGTGAAAYLGEVAERYHQAAVSFHKSGRHPNAMNALIQAILMEHVMGHANALESHADQLVQYAILNGDRKSLEVYDRAMQLARRGSVALANASILERARTVFFKSNDFSSLRQMYDVMDEGLYVMTELLKSLFMTKGVHADRLLKAVWVHLEVTFRYSMSWFQTLEMLDTLRTLSSVRQVYSHGMELLRFADKKYLGALDIAGRHYAHSGYYKLADPRVVQWLFDASSEHPADLSEMHAYLAQQVGSTPAEVAAAFSLYGDERMVRRIKGLTGELMFAKLRHAVLTHHYGVLKENRRGMSMK
jgi:tetratricopeptide (TPR) repeat protein